MGHSKKRKKKLRSKKKAFRSTIIGGRGPGDPEPREEKLGGVRRRQEQEESLVPEGRMAGFLLCVTVDARIIAPV